MFAAEMRNPKSLEDVSIRMNPENIPDTGNAGGKSLRLLRPSIVVLCGPAACGKSTFAQRHFRPTQIISSDWARAHVCDDERDQRYNAQAFALVHFLVEQRLTLNRLCVVDSTALTAPGAEGAARLGKEVPGPHHSDAFQCASRNLHRARRKARALSGPGSRRAPVPSL